jgi:hypothetical protein
MHQSGVHRLTHPVTTNPLPTKLKIIVRGVKRLRQSEHTGIAGVPLCTTVHFNPFLHRYTFIARANSLDPDQLAHL